LSLRLLKRMAKVFYIKPQPFVLRVCWVECTGTLFCRFTILFLTEWQEIWLCIKSN